MTARTSPLAAGFPGMLLVAGLLAMGGCETVDAEGAAAARAPAVPHLPAAAPIAVPDPADDPPALAVVRGGAVEGRTGPGASPFEVAVREPERPGHGRVIGRRVFQISLREDASASYPCDSCHRPGRPVIQPERAEDAHRYVLPRHPTESGTRCVTCHAPDDVESLVLASGERVELGHAYRLCAQCHYAQVDDWAAGAHGKRLDGWRGRRVVMGCADCHDPHAPAIQPRDPFPGPQLPRTGRAP